MFLIYQQDRYKLSSYESIVYYVCVVTHKQQLVI